ncbi:heparinase II/III family protein [Candidatus Sumerlaeota bacterium]|nr:heparinase II/III family protein [Candidatus Sumerlaeota bacterium]
MKIIISCFLLTSFFIVQESGASETIDAKRISDIAKMLPEKPKGCGSPITDRDSWDKLAQTPEYQSEIKAAEKLFKTPMPEIPDDLYLDFFQTGVRRNYEKAAGERRGRLATLVLAECAENKGRFLPEIVKTIHAVCGEKTWVLPAHDKDKENFLGKSVSIDLGSSSVGWDLALTHYLLGERLDQSTRALIRKKLEEFIFTPFRDAVNGKRPLFHWMTCTNNWNSVCLAQVTGAALAVLESREERALYIAASEVYSKFFLKGFTSDGYCSEGMAYWNYGFGRYVMLVEVIWQATDGKIDLLADEKAQTAALFGAKAEIINGIYPAFADCHVYAKPGDDIMWYVNKRLGLGLKKWEEISPLTAKGQIYNAMLYSFPNSATLAKPFPSKNAHSGIRTWFDQGGILICRPDPEKIEERQSAFAVALKGGHNAEHHNHNDVGSYIVVLGKEILLADPGLEVYTKRTFSSKRYESKVLNSYGHPVPVIAGNLQRNGSGAKAENIKTDFTEAKDTYSMEMHSCYDVSELKKLQRAFVYSREGNGALTVTDEAEFSTPQTYETALITFSSWKKMDDKTLLIYGEEGAVKIQIETPGNSFEINEETIEEDVRINKKPLRLGIRLKNPSLHFQTTIRISPEKKAKP